MTLGPKMKHRTELGYLFKANSNNTLRHRYNLHARIYVVVVVAQERYAPQISRSLAFYNSPLNSTTWPVPSLFYALFICTMSRKKNDKNRDQNACILRNEAIFSFAKNMLQEGMAQQQTMRREGRDMIKSAWIEKEGVCWLQIGLAEHHFH